MTTETSRTVQLPVACPHCHHTMRPALVKTAIWHQERLFVVEDIPAYMCDACVEQFYDPEATDILRRLTENGFASHAVVRETLVPVFSLAGRLPLEKMVVKAEQEEEIY